MSRVLVLLLLAACATPHEPFEGRPVLAEIKFVGNRSISGGDILSHIATAPTSGFFSKTARYYDADLFAIDVKRIERFYNQKGFYQAKVKDIREEYDDKGRVTLIVEIEEGPRAFVRKMDLNGLEALSKDEVNDVWDALPIHPGDEFDEGVYDKAKDVLVDQLREHGFAQAKTRGRVEVAPEEGAAHLMFDAEPGPRYAFGRVIVTGNKDIPADPIIEATGIHEGDRYSPQALALAQQRVYNLGTFSGVRIGIEPLADKPVVAVRVNVREAPFQTVRFGLGGAAETGRWELPRLRAEYTNRSLFGGLRRLELGSSFGYAFVPNPFPGSYDPERSGFTTRLSAQLTIPTVFFPGLDWISRGEVAREIQSGYSYDELAARTGLLYRRGKHSVSGSLNYVRDFNVNVAGAEDLSETQRFLECTPQCTLTYPELRYDYDGRDNLIEPTEGVFLSIGFQQGIKPGDYSYFRINPDVRGYAPVGRYAVLAVRAEYGGLFNQTAGGASPFSQRFFFGGQSEQRGYGSTRQGPKRGAKPCDPTNADQARDGCTEPFATEANSKGGTSAVLLAAELRIHADAIFNHLLVVPFVDASSVGESPKRPFKDGLEVALGLGLRYVTPFGPIRLDFGWLLNPRDVTAEGSDTVKPTRVSVHCPKGFGCVSEDRWSIHVSLGEAF